MKKLNSNFLFVLFLGLIANNLYSQNELELTESHLKIINENNIEIFQVIDSTVKYKPLVDGEVFTEEYKNELKKLEKLEPNYKAYKSALKDFQEKNSTLDSIKLLSNHFLSSKDKYSVKVKYLIKAQNLANKLGIDIKTKSSKSLLSSVLDDNPNSTERTIFLYKSDKKSRNREVQIYLKELERLSYRLPNEPIEYQEYITQTERLKTIPKTTKGKVLAKDYSTRETLFLSNKILDNNSLKSRVQFLGNYKVLLKDIEGLGVKNELVQEELIKKRYSMAELSKQFPVIKNDNGLYLISSTSFINDAFNELINNEIIELAKSKGFKVIEKKHKYYEDEIYVITKTSKVKLDAFTSQEIKSNPNYFEELDLNMSKFIQLISQTKSISVKLDEFLRVYNLKQSKTPISTINSWKSWTLKANELNKKISKVNEPYAGNYSVILLDESVTTKFNTFLDNLLASKAVLKL